MTRGQESNARFGEDIGRLEQKPRLLSGPPIGDLRALIRPAVRGKMNRRGSSGTLGCRQLQAIVKGLDLVQRR